MKLRSLIAVAALAVSSIASACWFTTDNFNACYIAGINNYVAHYTESQGLANATYANGQTVSSPITVYVKVSNRHPDQPGEAPGPKPVVKAILQYKVLPSGGWVTVRKIENVNWAMNWNHPVALFGKNNISLKGLPAGTEVLIRLYLSDGIYETGNLSADITSTVPNNATEASGGKYEGGWTAPFVLRVKLSGKERAR